MFLLDTPKHNEKNLSFKMSKSYIRTSDIIIRKEYFGGIAFNKQNAVNLELDKEGFFLLSILEKPLSLKKIKNKLNLHFSKIFLNSEIKPILDSLKKNGFVKIIHLPCNFKKPQKFNENNFLPNVLSAPETVHLSVTGKCNLNCVFCYGKSKTPDLSKKEIFRMIDTLSSMRVFQLAIGGGEPFLRKDIFEIIDYTRQKNIIPNITTNGTLITKEIIEKIKNKIGQLNLSYYENFKKLNDILQLLIKNNIRTGINILVTKKNLPVLKNIINDLLRYDIANIIILRPKPGKNKKWYQQNQFSKKELNKLKKVLDKYQKKINVDCSLTCLMYNIPKQELQKNSVFGCVAGSRFCTIKNNGDVFPCSFFNEKDYLAGNIVKTDFEKIWKKSQTFKKFRKLTKKIKGKCRTCEIKEHCKGCRRIVLEFGDDFYDSDKGCLKR
ncbi:radical SAM protein [Candidatus Woesearchaeota archaeon]|nr:radical SAM protein [Candidatus Woesearchaeota archaeon]